MTQTLCVVWVSISWYWTNSKTLAKRHGHNVCVLPLPLQVVMPSLSAHLKHITSYIPSICRDKTRKRSKLANGSHGSSQPLHLHLFLNRKLKRLEPIWMRNHSSRNFWLPSKPCLDVFITRLIVRNMSGNILLIQNCQSGSAWTLTSTQ